MKHGTGKTLLGVFLSTSAFAQTPWYDLRFDNIVAAYSCRDATLGPMDTELDGTNCLKFGVEYNSGGAKMMTMGGLSDDPRTVVWDETGGRRIKACDASFSGPRHVQFLSRTEHKYLWGAHGIAQQENSLQYILGQQDIESAKANFSRDGVFYIPYTGPRNAVYSVSSNAFDIRGYPTGDERINVKLVYGGRNRDGEISTQSQNFDCVISASQNVSQN